MNQGMMLVSQQQYFEGGRSICRNPILQKMFMMLGRAEKAGSGVDKIVRRMEVSGLAASNRQGGNTSGLCGADHAVGNCHR